MDLQALLRESLIWLQLFAALAALFSWRKVKHSHWKWFAIYLWIIFIVEVFSRWGLADRPQQRMHLYDYFGIPIQFLFFYWLYGAKSLANKWLFIIFSGLYALSFLPYFTLFGRQTIVYSLSYTVGNILLMFLVFLELLQQIKSDKIVEFRSNFMFYINIGIMLFYIGTLPFFSFYGLILKDMRIWTAYYLFFMIANHIMYLLFSCAFIWGKPNTY